MKIVSFVLLVGGCGMGNVDLSGPGLHLGSADAERGLSGTFTSQQTTIRFESWRTSAFAVRDDGSAGPEIAVRIMDGEGRTFAALAQGHLPEDWMAAQEPPAESASTPSFEASRQLVRMLREANLELPEVEVFGQLVDGLETIDTTATGPSRLAYATARIYRQRIYMYKRCLTGCLGYHSSTRIQRTYSDDAGASWVSYATYDQCNHGDCLQYSQGSYAGCHGPNLASSSSIYPANGTYCATSYSWASVSNTHNCNDDTEYQKAQVVANRHFGDEHYKCDNSSSNNSPTSDCTVNSNWY